MSKITLTVINVLLLSRFANSVWIWCCLHSSVVNIFSVDSLVFFWTMGVWNGKELYASIFAQLSCNCLRYELTEGKQTIRDCLLTQTLKIRPAKAKFTWRGKAEPIPDWLCMLCVLEWDSLSQNVLKPLLLAPFCGLK